jgi:predicted nucleotidyltransferase
MIDEISERALPVFKDFPGVKLAYLFGSRVTGDVGPMSDYDFAVYFDEDCASPADRQLSLVVALQRALNTDNIDLVVLNSMDIPELKYDIVTKGIRLYEVEPYHVLVEPRIWNEYFDFYDGLKRFGLTKA